MSYTAYGCANKFIKQIDVSSNELIEIEYKDADMNIVKGVYSITLKGRIWIGDEIEWDEEGYDKFKVLDGGVNILCESDDEEEEDEEEEDEEEETEKQRNESCVCEECNKTFIRTDRLKICMDCWDTLGS